MIAISRPVLRLPLLFVVQLLLCTSMSIAWMHTHPGRIQIIQQRIFISSFFASTYDDGYDDGTSTSTSMTGSQRRTSLPHHYHQKARYRLPFLSCSATNENYIDDDENENENKSNNDVTNNNDEESLDDNNRINPIEKDGIVNQIGKVEDLLKKNDNSNKLGINIGSQLEPLTERQAAELKAAAMEVINDGVAQGIDEIEKLRTSMNTAIEKQRAANDLKSEFALQKESNKLMNKIDTMTSTFLQETQRTRDETKLVAKADAALGEDGQGTEVGVWGTIDGAAVVVTPGSSKSSSSSSGALLGSVGAARQAASEAQQIKMNRNADLSDLQPSLGITTQRSTSKTAPTTLLDDGKVVDTVVTENRVVIVADTSQDPMAKALIPAFSAKLQDAIPTLEDIVIYRPTDTIPLGGDNALCAIIFCTSLTDRTTVTRIMERLLRRTLQPGTGKLGCPPTQIVGISSLGTERTEKFPYSLQNLVGGKLEQRRQVEEAIIATVQDRQTSNLPPLDYTLCKFGDIKDSTNSNSNKDSMFQLMPGDCLDGTTPLETATNVLLQAVAYQPYARNATLCAVGKLPLFESDMNTTKFWDDAFLRLDGPELERWTKIELGGPAVYDQLCEYLNEWATNFVLRPKGLTTPVRVEPSKIKRSSPSISSSGVRERSGVQLLFLPTATGKKYLSREEERQREMESRTGKPSSITTRSSSSKVTKEGGVEIVVELTTGDRLRVRAKRCNYADGVPLKELSEVTILKRLESAIDYWCKEGK